MFFSDDEICWISDIEQQRIHVLAPPIMEIKMIFEYRQTHTRHTENGKLPPIYQVKSLLSKLSKRNPFDVKEREESFVLTNRYRVQADTHAFHF